jgi:hypothetical protein
VKGRPDRDGTERRQHRERGEIVGAAGEAVNVGDALRGAAAPTLVEHLRLGIDRDHLGDVRRELPGDASGPAAEIEDAVAPAEVEPHDERPDELVAQTPAEPLVERGRAEVRAVVRCAHHPRSLWRTRLLSATH